VARLERSKIRNLRIAWSSDFPESDTQDEIRTLVEDVVQELTGEGAIIEQRMPDEDLVHKYELGEELFDLLAGTFSAEPIVFSEVASVASRTEEHSSMEAYMMALDRRDEVMRAVPVCHRSGRSCRALSPPGKGLRCVA
jgi:Asp-tRNA(Asn)/Glu-tRNA(Gln) amidotransferase A subunit family amidase